MSFLKLYQYAAAKAADALVAAEPARDEEGRIRAPVDIQSIRLRIIDLGHAQEIEVHGCVLEPEVSLGHIKILDLREGRHEDPNVVASIRFHEHQTNCWIRFVVCKEMMHLFDSEDEAVFDPQRFRRLLRELETPPLSGELSPMLMSEFNAEWMALLILCPREQRNEWKAKLEAGEVDEMVIAQRFRIPKDAILPLCSDYYEDAYNRLIAKPLADEAAADAARPDPNDPVATPLEGAMV